MQVTWSPACIERECIVLLGKVDNINYYDGLRRILGFKGRYFCNIQIQHGIELGICIHHLGVPDQSPCVPWFRNSRLQ